MFRMSGTAFAGKEDEGGAGRLPECPHEFGRPPDVQYPMGGGGLQWRLVRPCEFVVGAVIIATGLAKTATFEVDIGESAPYEGMAKLHQYLTMISLAHDTI
jgi:hypothetical protein